jgi:hypothetical protein
MLNPRVHGNTLWPRPVQLAVAAPSFLLWTSLASLAVLWYVGSATSAISGRLATGDWRIPYLMFVLLVVLAGAGATARTLWLACRGRSRLWWHACSFGSGIVLLGLLGIVGD